MANRFRRAVPTWATGVAIVVSGALAAACGSSADSQSYKDGASAERQANYHTLYSNAQAACTVASSEMPASDNIDQWMSGCEAAWNGEGQGSAIAGQPSTSTSSTAQNTAQVISGCPITASAQCPNWNVPAGSDLTGIDLAGADLASAQLGFVTLNRANLSGANLAGANLSTNGGNSAPTYTSLQGTNLSKANLTGADLSFDAMTDANFDGANLTNARMSGALPVGMSAQYNATFVGAIWSNTTCPDNTNSNNDGGTCIGHLTAPAP